MSAFLRTLKKTGMRAGEACRLRWIDMDKERCVITVDNPEKHGNPRSARGITPNSGKLVVIPLIPEVFLITDALQRPIANVDSGSYLGEFHVLRIR